MGLLIILVPIVLLIWDFYTTDKDNRIRYAKITKKMKPGIRYPRWRLEEMLKEEDEQNNG